MNNDDYAFNDPRLLFALWKQLTGEDLIGDLNGSNVPNAKSVDGAKRKPRENQKDNEKSEATME